MKCCTPNLESKGRWIRAVVAVCLLIAAYGVNRLWGGWPASLCLVGAGFVAFEAVRGWCVLRACGVKTRF